MCEMVLQSLSSGDMRASSSSAVSCSAWENVCTAHLNYIVYNMVSEIYNGQSLGLKFDVFGDFITPVFHSRLSLSSPVYHVEIIHLCLPSIRFQPMSTELPW